MEIYHKNKFAETRWASFENSTGQKGAGAASNKGMKGSPFQSIGAGETKTLLDIEGSGIIHRIWMTLSERSPVMLRSVRIDMFWDGAATPAVSAPLGDFFCAGLGILVPFENELFSSPEGRSLNCNVPMPFYTKALIKLTNESDKLISHFFYDINFILRPEPTEKESLYFHSYWNRENPTLLGEDYTLLPTVSGNGRFIGVNVGIITDPAYAGSWWGEGEVKLYLDGDGRLPTLVGTGTEDYIGTGWGQGIFCHRYQGCLVWDKEKDFGSYYRLHIPDPIYFQKECKVTIQQIGGAQKDILNEFKKNGVPFTVITADYEGSFIRFLEDECEWNWDDERIDAKKAWLNFLRQDDVSATAYFYLDSAENLLPPLPDCKFRTFRTA